MLLRDLDTAGRVPGAIVYELDEALAFLRQLELDNGSMTLRDSALEARRVSEGIALRLVPRRVGHVLFPYAPPLSSMF